jgi:tetratricopeptide (TPR) repeat protein
MISLRLFFVCCVGSTLLPAQAALSQSSANEDDIKASLHSCQIIRKTLDMRARSKVQVPARADDEFTAAGEACDQLDKAIASSNAAQTQSTAANLRPTLARLAMAPTTPQEQLAALEKVTSGTSGIELFDRLPDLAKRAFDAGEIEKAKAYSTQLLQMAPEYPKSWNYGNAIFYSNFVLGEVSLQQGNVAQASQYLLASGATPGSPTLVSFGPNMTLAKELLEKGQSDVVLQYLALCKNFWKADHGKLDEWSDTVRSGGTPDFTSNLSY